MWWVFGSAPDFWAEVPGSNPTSATMILMRCRIIGSLCHTLENLREERETYLWEKKYIITYGLKKISSCIFTYRQPSEKLNLYTTLSQTLKFTPAMLPESPHSISETVNCVRHSHMSHTLDTWHIDLVNIWLMYVYYSLIIYSVMLLECYPIDWINIWQLYPTVGTPSLIISLSLSLFSLLQITWG